MGEIFTRLNHFLNEPHSIKVLSVLVLIMALLWILSGFSFLDRKKDDDQG